MVEYINGNTKVWFNLDDGTKIRYVPDDEPAKPEFPESIDLKITNFCSMNCPMCFTAGTKIMMADYTYKNIEDIKVGDKIIGFEENTKTQGGKRHIEVATVLQTFVHVESELIKIKTHEGNEILSTPNHPFLSQGIKKNHSRKFVPIEKINIGGTVYTYGFPIDEINYDSIDYAIGYTVGSWVGDGVIHAGTDKNGYNEYCCRFVTLDDEINDMVFKMISKLSNNFYRLQFAMTKHEDNPKMSVRSNKKSAYEFLKNLINEHMGANTSKEYCSGYLAGFCDSEGHVDNQRGMIRLTNTNVSYLKECERALDILKIDHIFEEHARPKGWKNWKPVYNVRIVGKFGASKFLWYARPTCERKSFKNYIKTTTQYYTDTIISKESIVKKQYVYNLETSSHTFIANNFMVHNCHEKSGVSGAHGNLNNCLLDSLKPYTELAIGGGDPMCHPELGQFLLRMKEKKVICNITVHWKTFLENYKTLKLWKQEKLIYGVGISVNEIIPDEVIEKIQNFQNAVIHTVVGMANKDVYEQFYDRDINILLLGYKVFGRGTEHFMVHNKTIMARTAWLADNLKCFIERFKAVSFDNLAILRLDLKNNLTKEAFDQMYMGDDGTFTMYVDLVNEQYAVSSTSFVRHNIDSTNIVDLFAKIREGVKL